MPGKAGMASADAIPNAISDALSGALPVRIPGADSGCDSAAIPNEKGPVERRVLPGYPAFKRTGRRHGALGGDAAPAGGILDAGGSCAAACRPRLLDGAEDGSALLAGSGTAGALALLLAGTVLLLLLLRALLTLVLLMTLLVLLVLLALVGLLVHR
ncbi:hypothetical protein [Bordetella genomosp. 9]|uniref:hypothetical protein n=1 Tax=Bordetella genomosp. 9 TaxID=1416803 RepID=UPI0012FBC601|nr:hypothetical protein [Bordetella genomosp. 9]